MGNQFAKSGLLEKLVEGRLNDTQSQHQAVLNNEPIPPFLRYVVLEVIFDPFLLDKTRIETISKFIGEKSDAILKQLPRNTIIAQKVRDGTEMLEGPEILLPFLPPHLELPLKVGEHVWVMHDDHSRSQKQGYYLWRISEIRAVDDINYTHADRRFQGSSSLVDKAGGKDDGPPGFPNGVATKKGNIAETASIAGKEAAYEDLLKKTDAGITTIFESVPRYSKRPGDWVAHGSNNSLIVLGTDRVGRPADKDSDADGGKSKGIPGTDEKKYAGMIDMVVGRGQTKKTEGKKVTNSLSNEEMDKSAKNEDEKEGDPDFGNDLTRLYLAMKTKADKNLNIQIRNLKSKPKDSAPAGVFKSDQVRLIARESIVIMFQPKPDSPAGDCSSLTFTADGNMIWTPSEAGVIKLGGDDADRAILCTGVPAANASGMITADPIGDTMGGLQGGGGPFGTFASKILVKAGAK